MADFQQLDEDSFYVSLRKYARVSAYLSVGIRPVSEEEKRGLESRITAEPALTEHPEMPELDDEALSACLQIINSKLDLIIRMLAFPWNSRKELNFTRVNISAGGMSMFSGEPYGLDSSVEIRFMLPTAPLMVFYVYGKVVRCVPSNQSYQVSIEFTDIDDDIREQIAKYVFRRQREILRKKRSNRP